ncbi:hypothetical protein GCM10007415_09580 [Parapedobacter pyrenivorans]|uniref:Uncharacterized protein n=1 Tax=Parapedobacter pyrenivorans TaxID=1305674 RepID=A0A917HHL9_9SPHI|nr:hypothetical protein [Parapedobacter pyrenivorans]GGG79447.1 hypothetical protein GCM10007415_09580 [Parapedobacter pyrenivorans]
MSNCNLTFYKKTDGKKGTDGYKNYDGPQAVADLSKVLWEGITSNNDMKDDISWVDTSSQAWVRVYSKANFQGRTALIGPDQHVSMKTIRDESDEDDMDDTIESFQLYDHKPDVNTSTIINNLLALYPGSVRSRKNNRYETEWYAQDSQYRIYDPSIQLSGNTLSFSMDLDHIQLEQDDHAVITFSMDLNGGFVDQIKVTYDIADATQVPEWAIKLIDGTIEAAKYGAMAIADGAVIVLTDGVGVVATVEINRLIKYTAEALTFCVDHLNIVLGAVFKLQSDGGTANFPAIVSHGIARLILAYYQELYGPDPHDALGFNEQRFLNTLDKNPWQYTKHNPFVEFSEDAYSYRSYYPDNTFFYAKGGALSTVKIDAITDNRIDDHLVLQAIFDPYGKLFAVAGCIDIFSIKNNTSDYTMPASGVFAYNAEGTMIHVLQGGEEVTEVQSYDSLETAFADSLRSALRQAGDEYDIKLTNQQITLIDASIRVLKAMGEAIANG